MKHLFTILTALFYLAPHVHAQVDTINPATNKLLMQRLQPGTHSYAVFTMDSITKEIGYSDIWVRSVAFSKRNGEPVVNFGWKWYRHDSLFRDVHDICLRKNLQPIYAHTLLKGTTVVAVNFNDTAMVAADSIANNKVDAKKKVLLNPPVYNWEWDMETFGLLPITKVGQKFMIAFLDPFDVKAAYYPHTVTGTDELALNDEVKIKCWILRVNYNAEAYADFWISRQSHQMLKMREYYKGKYRFKVMLY